MSDVLVSAENVSKKFCRSLKRSLWYGIQDLGRELVGQRHGGDGLLRPDEFWAVKNVSFEVRRGECLGLVGRNGAGKTTLLRMMNGLIKPDTGRIEMRGRVGALIALGAGFNPILTGRENIYVNASVLGLTKRETDEKLEEIIDFSEIRDFIDTPVQSYSSGMQMKLGFAVATALKPDILIIDEVLAVGDHEFRAKSYKRLGEIMADSAIIIVSHNEAQLYRLCHSALWLDKGVMVEQGEANGVLDHYGASKSGINQPNCHNSVLSSNVLEFARGTASEELLSGSRASFEFELVLKEEITPSSVSLHFGKSGDFVCYARADLTGRNELILSQGVNRLRAQIPLLPLVQGDYVVSLIIYEKNDRSLVVQANGFVGVHITGPRPSSSHICLPLSVSRVT